MEGKRQLEKRDFGKRLSLDSSLVVSTKYSFTTLYVLAENTLFFDCYFLSPVFLKPLFQLPHYQHPLGFCFIYFLHSKASKLLECLCSVLIGKCHNLSASYIITLIPAELVCSLYKNATVSPMPNANSIYGCSVTHLS
jgi:hypothetical protein